MLAGDGGTRLDVRRLRVGEEEAGQRLDNFLARVLKGVPRGHVYRLLRTGQVRVNGGRRPPRYRLAAGDELRLPPVHIAARETPAGPVGPVAAMLAGGPLYEDEVLLVVDKPAGIPVHGGSGLSGGLIEALRTLRGDPDLELAHRLDRDTSGCLVIARRRSALRALHAAFREGEVEKRYLALLVGRVERPFASEAPLKRYVKRSGERHVAVSAAGRPAATRFRPLAVGDCATLVEALPETGRTHQIRVHAAHAGHPVVGDARYGDREVNRRFAGRGAHRLALHAASVEFTHPCGGRRTRIEAPLPEDLGDLIRVAGLAAGGAETRG